VITFKLKEIIFLSSQECKCNVIYFTYWQIKRKFSIQWGARCILSMLLAHKH